MKKLVYVLIFLGALALALPGAFGFLAEKEHRRVIDAALEQAPQVGVVVDDFERGWFSSHATYRLEYDDPTMRQVLISLSEDETYYPPSLVLDTEIYHGPFAYKMGDFVPIIGIFDATMKLEMGPEKSYDIPGRLTTRINIDGSGKTSYEVDAGSGSWEKADWRWEGASMHANFNRGITRVYGNGRAGVLHITGTEGGRISIGSITYDSDSRRTDYGFWLSDGTFAIEQMTVEENDQPLAAVDGMSVAMKSGIADERASIEIEMRADRYSSEGWEGGPAVMKMAFNGLDAASLGALYELTIDMQAAEDPDVASQRALPELMQYAQTLVTRGFDLRIDEFHVDMPMGQIDAFLNVVFPQREEPVVLGPQVLEGVEGDGFARLPVEFVEQSAMEQGASDQLQAMVDTGFIQLEDGRYVIEFAYSHGLVTINGMPMPIPGIPMNQ